ncbi:MAG: NAD(P)/FAD-dependent oxidoreductase [Candidatus Methanomethylicaceae archaeon]|jgi:digeranylgeranylglycerophospholipid reductase
MRILVIGAGPAGLAAALSAAKSDSEVLIFEKNSRVGMKACGEALGREGLDFVGMEPSRKFVMNEVKGFRISYKGKFIREASFMHYASSPGYVVDKPLLLEAILEKAKESGAKICFNARVREADPKTGKIKLEDGTIVQGDLIVCADGLGSIARSHLDYSNYDVATCLQYCCPLPREIDQEYLYLDIIGEGYAWVFPKKDHANIGAGLPNRSGSIKLLKNYLDRYIKNLRVEPIGRIMGAQASIGGPLKSFGIGKIVVAGEAAGCVMPLSGEGIRFGFYGGIIAHQPEYKNRFMAKYGNNMENSRKMLVAIEGLNDGERIDLLRQLEDPLKTLEGELPKIATFLHKPKLLMKLAQVYLS